MEPAKLKKLYQEVGDIRYFKTVTTKETATYGSCSLCGAVVEAPMFDQHSLWHTTQDTVMVDSTVQSLKNMAKDLDHDGSL